MEGIEEKLSRIKERLLDPFNVENLEKDFEELLGLMKKAAPEELEKARGEFEEVKKLLSRNLSIISGSLKPILERGQGGLFSRRV
ncbi:hypothetical protein BCF55_0130 [Hydrogenivirga caldilitoris]|uniref:Uncharacterized protein n=1 Tax=Hydrogenivirga caldilitoris TaxID=246264 RepID=A0A497XSH6_9AQUI|nr:hypothetical protein [Hydrogenivirga caldilitoris]RLJ69873.1 hypothetical protein BCF55_0130 [Hydrogenivirga caldilitoris]